MYRPRVSALLAFLVEAVAGAVMIVALTLFVAGVTETLATAAAAFIFIHVAGAAFVASLPLFVTFVAQVAAAIVNANNVAIAIASVIAIALFGGSSTHAHKSNGYDGGKTGDNLFHIILSPN
jgi:hypothetical protein